MGEPTQPLALAAALTRRAGHNFHAGQKQAILNMIVAHEVGTGFSKGHPALAKRSRRPCRLPCGPVAPASPPRRGPGQSCGPSLARTLRRDRSRARLLRSGSDV